MMKTGVIGCGEIAEIHSEALKRNREGFTAAYDIDEEVMLRFCEKTGAKPAVSADQLLADPGLDAVYICTRHNSHVELAEKALRAGVKVFLEKPIALSANEAGRLNQIEHSLLRVGYNMRHTPTMRKLSEAMREREAIPESFEAHMVCAPFFAGWAGDPSIGGGVLVCEGSHMVDLIEYTLNHRIKEVIAQTRHIRTTEDRCADYAAVLLRLDNGVTGTLTLHDQGTYPYHVYPGGKMIQITIYSSQGTFAAEAYGDLACSNDKETVQQKANNKQDRISSWGYQEQARKFIINETGLCGFEQALHVAEVVDACKRSAEEKRWISIGNSIQ